MVGKLYALSDIHISYKFNLEAFSEYISSLVSRQSNSTSTETPSAGPTSTAHPDDAAAHVGSPTRLDFTQDGLILAGDIGEKLEHIRLAFELTTQKFKTVWWVPGNHELYTLPGAPPTSGSLSSVAATTSSVSPATGTRPSLSMRTKSGVNETDPSPESEQARRESEREAVRLRDRKLDYTLRGEDKYRECCRIAQEYGVLTPEDEFVRWDYESASPPRDDIGNQGKDSTSAVLVCPIFTLYDYSFRPESLDSVEEALEWAMEENVKATDEHLLHPDPYSSREEWCWALVRKTEERLAAAAANHDGKNGARLPLVIINHWPLRKDLVHIPLVPRFVLWCGTRLTHDWHTKFNAKVVITGHLHVRRTDWKDGTRFEEVSLGYPRQWEGARLMGRGVGDMIREILPATEFDSRHEERTIYRRHG